MSEYRTGKSIVVVIVCVLLAVIVAVPLGIVVFNGPKIPAVILPDPNAFETLRMAGARVQGSFDGDIGEMIDVEVLKKFLSDNERNRQFIDEAVTQDGMVPIDYAAGMSQAIKNSDPSHIRSAMRILQAEARLAELDNSHGNRADALAKMFVLCSKVSKGGLLIHVQVAAAYERLSLNGLIEVSEKLNEDEKSRVLALVKSADRQRHSFDEIVEREHTLFKIENGTLSGTWMIALTKRNQQPLQLQHQALDGEILALQSLLIGKLSN